MAPRPSAADRLDRAEVLASAVAIADADGIDAVTLRRVATVWNVTPMALYWHFEDKDALLDAMVGQILSEVDLSASDEPDLRTVTTALLGVLRAHPTLAELLPTRFMRTRAGLDLAERVVGLMRAEGHSPVAAAQLSVVLLTVLIGLVSNQPSLLAIRNPAVREDLLTGKRARLKSLPAQAYPHLTETADYFLDVPDEDDYYERGLTLLLNGVRLT